MTTFIITVTVEGSQADAETIREEVVGAVEDTWERDRISASVGEVDQVWETADGPKP